MASTRLRYIRASLSVSKQLARRCDLIGPCVLQALDYLAIGVHELASMSERRLERLVNPAYSDLPAFLVENGGLNSGFMLAHCTAASLGSWVNFIAAPTSDRGFV